eukprot:CAMPEP_0119333306 /NCGR_PEP_ID=MMETSP1333-20130426/84860_1 /TAXON_ID=418940 /ORGANISM="Scyphosphaera apsteinii, Strain RCC1455" /LENGTH=409 /DNA_ID=CAMNT_0007343345 /DNA_START=46 /DNA_END=1275 /DNA_ORIENTATION=+
MSKEYDILLVGVTGFTGKLAVEYLLQKEYSDIRWAVCARNENKAKEVLYACLSATAKTVMPTIEVADLVCSTPEQTECLRAVVRKTQVVITTAGPFEKYGTTLVKLCAEEGVHYADITGETDFFRSMIAEYDQVCKRTGAKICMHCGHDCIPWDCTVLEMHKLAQQQNAELVEISTYTELPPGTAMSGGTLATAVHQLSKKRKGGKPSFDPLLQASDGTKSLYATKITSPKKSIYVKAFKRYGGPWIMGPVMANCVRRSNALLQYSEALRFSDCLLRSGGSYQYVKDTAYAALVAAAIYLPFFRRFLPSPGQGPTSEDMAKGFLNLHAMGVAVQKDTGERIKMKSTFKFFEDVTYLSTAKLLVESGRVLLAATDKMPGVSTPATLLGNEIIKLARAEIGASFEISLVTE